jgi:hypothetical protein
MRSCTTHHQRKAMTMHRRITTALGALGAAALMLVPTALAGAAPESSQSGFAGLRAATAKYHKVDAALASGRVDLHLCVDHMGQHYANPETFSDGVLDPTDPEALVYTDDGKGHLRLVAVEWVSTTPGHVAGQGDLHLNTSVGLWVLHAWVWAPNPDGVHADMNSRIGVCP